MNNRLATLKMRINTVEDIVAIRRAAREMASEMCFGLSDQTRIATAVSELARNAIVYGGGGDSELSDESTPQLRILRVIIRDQGPGIADIATAMRDGFSSGTGLGAGLPGCKRLMGEFFIASTPGQGTEVRIEIHAIII